MSKQSAQREIEIGRNMARNLGDALSSAIPEQTGHDRAAERIVRDMRAVANMLERAPKLEVDHHGRVWCGDQRTAWSIVKQGGKYRAMHDHVGTNGVPHDDRGSVSVQAELDLLDDHMRAEARDAAAQDTATPKPKTYTPGPWIVIADEGKGEHPNHQFRFVGTADYDHIVAKLTDAVEIESNAYLMAAAPDLLKVCQEIMEHGTDDWEARMRTLRDAIAKAQGRLRTHTPASNADKVADALGRPGDVPPGYDRSDWNA